MQNEVQAIVAELRTYHNSKNLEGMARFGIATENAIGIKIPVLRGIAKAIGKNHELALQLWDTKIHEARILAVYIADYKRVSEALMEKWLKDFASWDVCDQTCGGLFDKTIYAYDKAAEWTQRESEFEKRAGFVMMATLAVHDKKAEDKNFLAFLSLIEKEACDERNFVKKAVNWALRQIGKRNMRLNAAAVLCAKRIRTQSGKSSKWIATDALRELQDEKHLVQIQKISRRNR